MHAAAASGIAAAGRALLVSALAILLGAVFALGLYEVWDLDTRWLVVAVVGIAGLSVAMALARHYSDLVLVGALFAIPLASFTKWFWPSNYAVEERGNLVYAGLLGVGLFDFIIVGLYLSWFHRVFGLRQRTSPGMLNTDWLVLGYIAVHLLSSIGAADPELALGGTQYLAKFALFYFYVSRNLAARHIPWLLAALAFGIVLEASIGSVQFGTGKLLGLALDKGAGGSDAEYQYSVPGIESYKRATGTAYDSHSLGHLVAMMLPFMLVQAIRPGLGQAPRLLFGTLSALAVLTIVLTLSRAAWVATFLALAFGTVMVVTVWRERQVVPMIAGGLLAGMAVLPFVAGFIYDRFAKSPYEVLTTRFDQYEVAGQIITLYPLFGFGPGNWVQALQRHDFLWLEVLPPHNVLIWIMAETGLVGVSLYLGILATTAARLLRLVRQRQDLVGRLAMATLVALVASVLVGLTDPTYREPNCFTMFWTLVALSVALPRIAASVPVDAPIPLPAWSGHPKLEAIP